MNRFREAREASGYQQKEVALTLGVSKQTLSYWETGGRSPSKENIVKLAEMYGVPVAYLMGVEEYDQETLAKIRKEPVTIDELPGLTDEQRRLLKNFNRCSPANRIRLLAYAEGVADNS